ncbi:MFS transporter [Candidatus Acidianus copahuensis]|uniref:MFS transporter n=1 Tax=Candidatus Acidianus copahuensis TaxID=1160895 RepID=A0A031LM12_9CREN|nr:MFS transporter [Candidatus Acidianus copahuensis]EZQ02266.1 MFS transporter [Candidatus Acidianus copahuensis]
MASKPLQTVSVLIPFLLSAYVMYSITFVIDPLSHYFNTGIPEIILAVTLSWIGGAIGGLIFGRLSDVIGRKKALLFSFFLICIPEIINFKLVNIYELYGLWFLIGFGVNGENGISYAIIAELRFTNLRGFLGGLMQGFYALGALLGAITSLFITNFRLIFLVPGLIFALSFLLWPFVPEEKSRFPGSKISEIFRKDIIKITIIGSIVSLASFLFIIPAFSLMPTTLQLLHFKNYDVIIAIGDILATFSYALSGYISDVKGRRFAALVFSSIAVIASFIFTFSFIIVGVFLVYFFSAFFAFFGVWLSELYPQRIRGAGTNFALLIGRLIGGGFGTLFVTLLPFSLRDSLGIVLIAMAILASLGIYFLN